MTLHLLRYSAALLLVPALLAGEFDFGAQTLTVPDGFIVERAAGPGLIDRPIAGDFDEQGRLYVAESSGSNDPVDRQLAEKPHRILRLEDVDGDGRFDRRTVFADNMMFPEGAMWFDGSLYVTAPPSIWKLTDTDGDGVADEREEWYDAKTLTGCANDLHGPYLGPDGWIYWCKGAFAGQTHELTSGKTFETRAAHIFRRHPSGGPLDVLMTGGMDNPVDVVFTPEGERIFTTTFLQHPAGGRRDGLIHAIHGGVYGKPHGVIEGHPRTGPLMPVLAHLGPAAPAGLARYESSVFGREYEDNLFAALFNLHKITRHILKPLGPSYVTEDIDFLVSSSTDFHPTDVIVDADGSLLVIDTGGWYKLCCPTSQLWKPDVLGAIYRVRKAGARVADPRGLELAWDDVRPERLRPRLGDERPAVARRAIEELARRGAASVACLEQTLRGSKSPRARRNALWALARIEGEPARKAARLGLRDGHSSVRHAAIHGASLWRDAGAAGRLIEMLGSPEEALARAAAEALGRIGDSAAVPALFEAAARLEPASPNGLPDRIIEHSIIYALIEIADPQATRAGLESRNPFTRRAALIALDQMERGKLEAKSVVPLLSSADPVLRQTAEWIAARHGHDWGSALAGYYSRALRGDSLQPGLEGELARFAENPAIAEMLAETAREGTAPKQGRITAVRAMAAASPRELLEIWEELLPGLLESREPELLEPAVAIARGIAVREMPSPIEAALLALARDSAVPNQLRLEALGAVCEDRPLGDLFPLAAGNLGPETPVPVRAAAAEVLSRAALSEEELTRLADALRHANPLEIPKLLTAFERAPSERAGLRLLETLAESPGLAGVHPSRLRELLAKFPPAVQRRGEELLRRIDRDGAAQAARLDALLAELAEGDARRGQAIFNSTRAACSSCHAIGYLGGNLGPDLTRIGQIRTQRDLLEAVVYPSASFVRSYEPVLVITRDGEPYSGILRKDAPEEVVIATGPGAEVVLPRAQIAEIRPGQLSVMPQGLDQQLTKQELADLLAFLKSTRW